MRERLELLEHHRRVIQSIESVMNEAYKSNVLSKQYETGETLSIDQAVEEYLILWSDDPFYHLDDPLVKKESKESLILAVQSDLEGNVVYRPDDASGDVICKGCYWFKRDDANPNDCVIASFRNKITKNK